MAGVIVDVAEDCTSAQPDFVHSAVENHLIVRARLRCVFRDPGWRIEHVLTLQKRTVENKSALRFTSLPVRLFYKSL